MRAWFVAVLTAACSSTTHPELPAGPAPVTLTQLAAPQLRALASTDGFVAIDAHGAVRWGRVGSGAAPFTGTLLDRGDSAFGHLFMDDGSVAGERHWYRSESELAYDVDQFASLSDDPTTEVLVLADSATPARITAYAGIREFGNRAVALAAGAANTATRYRFGATPWPEQTRAALALQVDQLGALAGTHPGYVLLEITDASTTGELIAALGALSKAGVPHVRLHRLMGWGEIPPREILFLNGPTAEDDEFNRGELPAKVAVGSTRVDGPIHERGVETAVSGYLPRFRYCFEMRLRRELSGTIQLAFDVAADGTVANATASGFDGAIATCVAGAVFDLEVTRPAVPAPGRATVDLIFGQPSVARPVAQPTATALQTPSSGFWCFTSDDVGLCGREQWQCEAALEGFEKFNGADEPKATPCEAQRTAWTSNGKLEGNRIFPTKTMCGPRCKVVR